jgi:GTP pyrophosphokinase
MGNSVWDRFKTGKSGTLWYLKSIAEVDRELGSTPLGEELTRIVARLENLN